jgi:hypothetical protein
MKKAFKKIPKFKSEAEEAAFWLSHDSTEYVDWERARVSRTAMVERKEVTVPVSIPKATYNRLRKLAEKREISSSALAKRFVREGLKREAAATTRRKAA